VKGAFLAGEVRDGELKISSRKELEAWLQSLPPERGRRAAAAIAARAALRVACLATAFRSHGETALSGLSTFATFVLPTVVRSAALYPNRADKLRDFAEAGIRYAVSLPNLTNPVEWNSRDCAVFAARSAFYVTVSNIYTDWAGFCASSVESAAFAAQAAAAAHEISNQTFALFAEAMAVAGRNAEKLIWASVASDASYITGGGAPEALASKPLWLDGEPAWVRRLELSLREALPARDDWQVWFDWYDRRLEGVSDPEEVDLIFATVPESERAKGPAVANRWIRERLEELERKKPATESPDPASPQPIKNLPSPFTFGLNDAGQVAVVAGPQNTPVITFPGDEDTHRRWLAAARKRSERILADLRAQKFHNVRSSYSEGLERYLMDLPTAPGDGDFLLADGEARTLRSLFSAEKHLLPEAFAASLKTMLESHFALLGFYPEVERYLGAARRGEISAPLPQEAIKAFTGIVRENTPQAFSQEVSQGLGEVMREAPRVELEPEDIRTGHAPIDPPAYPYDEPDPEKSHAFAVMSSLNALYGTVWELAKKEPSKIVHWVAIEELLRPYATAIIHWLQSFVTPAL
jgi:hypothetical protein